ncbi:hypothetical protein C8R46DRAFT_1233956 [Mycena filopes]|nr:hypothetical protein C8R46DRAFT_1233956 [Mycena filopes]
MASTSASGSTSQHKAHSSVVQSTSALQPQFVNANSSRVAWIRIREDAFRNVIPFFNPDVLLSANTADVVDVLEALHPSLIKFRAYCPDPPRDLQLFLQAIYRVVRLFLANNPEYSSQFEGMTEPPADDLAQLLSEKRVTLPTSNFVIPFITVRETPKAPPKPKPRIELPPPPVIEPPEAPPPKRTRQQPASRDVTAGQTSKSAAKSEPSASRPSRQRRTQAQILHDETSSKLLPTPVPKNPAKVVVPKPSKRKHSPVVNPEEEPEHDATPPPPKKSKTKHPQHVSFEAPTEDVVPTEAPPKKKKRKKKVDTPPAEFMEDEPVASTSAVMLPPPKSRTVVVGPPLPPARPPSPPSPAVSPPDSPRPQTPIKSEFLNIPLGSALATRPRPARTMPVLSNEGVSSRVQVYQSAMIPTGDWAEGRERPVPPYFIFASLALLKCLQCLLRGDDCGGDSISVTCPDCREHKVKCSRTMEPIEIIALLDGLRPYFALAPDHLDQDFVSFLNARRHSNLMAQLHARSLYDTQLHMYSLLATFENQGRTLPADVLIRYFEDPADVARMVTALENMDMSAVRLVLAHTELRPVSAVKRHLPDEQHSIGNSYHTYGMPASYHAFDDTMEPQELEGAMASVFVPGQLNALRQQPRQETPAAHRAISSSLPSAVDTSPSTFSQANLDVHNTLNSLVARLPPSSTTFPGPPAVEASIPRTASGSLAIHPTLPTMAQVAAASPRDPTPLVEFDPEVEPSLHSAAPSPPAAPSSPAPPKSPTPPPKKPTPPFKAQTPSPPASPPPLPSLPKLSTPAPTTKTFGSPTLLSPLSPSRPKVQCQLTNFFPTSPRKAARKPASNATAGPSTGGA